MPATSSPEARHTEDAIREAIIRLCRPDGYGGAVIERAAIVAEGAHAGEIEKWILAHGGEPELPTSGAGIHGPRADRSAHSERRAPRRFVLPITALESSR